MKSRLTATIAATLVLGTLHGTTAEARGMRFGFGLGVGIGLAAGAMAHHNAEREAHARRRAEIHAEEQAMRRKQQERERRAAQSRSKPKADHPAPRKEVAKAKPTKPAPQVAALPKPALIPASITPPAGSAELSVSRPAPPESGAEASRAPAVAFSAGRAGQPALNSRERAPGTCQKIVQGVGAALAEPCSE